MVSAAARRQQVAYARTRGVSERRACALMSVARSAMHYESRLIKKDAAALAAMSILSAQYPRYGYRRIHVFLERQGHRMSIDRAWRICRICGRTGSFSTRSRQGDTHQDCQTDPEFKSSWGWVRQAVGVLNSRAQAVLSREDSLILIRR